jgi:colanic acid/amylovoran biosynthesis protein
MRALVLWGSDSSANLGVRVLGQGAGIVASRLGATETINYNFGDVGPGFEIGRKQLVVELLRKGDISRWLSGFDLVLDTGSGDSFSDIYGISRLSRIALLRILAVRAGTRVVLTPQTIGPFGTRLGRLLARWSLVGVDMVMVRDSQSKAVLRRLGSSVRFENSTDLVFALPGETEISGRHALVNVSGLLWNDNPHVDCIAYQALIRGTLSELNRRGIRFRLLAHVHGGEGSDDDAAVVQQLHREGFGEAAILPQSLDDARELISQSSVVLGARMHACLNALSLGIPAVALAYSRKFSPLLRDLGWSEVIELRDLPSPEYVANAVVRASELQEEALAVRIRGIELLSGSVEKALRVRG